ncbi:FAD/NAD(P)-binding domain-containing protein [Meira miltonrushii]|uniref:FAD/NAD(P)-binding domain-containing protein n=1 Tax=Meira miltonrushii TaxID=1280837 RepID=A0A316VBU6_9BASI|nr:FAD/NAD(P)-binding domain-containing protein [Meira miltonrushii]PWN33451.1 FAD/NAD(P)-binding domain-containing protein [Meira miltonrushii]
MVGISKSDRQIKVAIIGSGLAGLTASHLLSQSAELRKRYDVHIFEKNESLGLDASSITIPHPTQQEKSLRVDVPMRSINAGYYPNLTRLYKSLGVKLKKTNFTFSFSSIHAPRSPFMLYNGQSGIRGFSVRAGDSSSHPSSSIQQRISTNFSQSLTLLIFAFSYIVLLFFALYHHARGHLLDPMHPINREPFLHWSNRHKRYIDPTFIRSVTLTLFSAVTTSSIASVEQIPAAEILLYISSTFLRDHHKVQGGVQIVQDALARNIPLDNVHTSYTVERIQSDQQGYTISVADKAPISGFQHVILATPATFSNSLIESYCNSIAEKVSAADQIENIRILQDNLAQIRYEESMVINHSDRSLLPKNKKDWQDLNLVSANTVENDERYRLLAGSKHGGRSAMATHLIRSTATDGELILQTTNPTIWPKKDSILSSSNFVRALTPISKQAIDGLFEWTPVHLTFSQRVTQFFRLFNFEQSTPTTIHSDWITACFSILRGKKHSLRLGKLQSSRSLQPVDSEKPGNIWVCGSYAQGIPLLEGCVTSSMLVVNEILQNDI